MRQFAIMLLVFCSLLACAQQKEKETPAPDDTKINSRYVRPIGDTMTLMLIENVQLNYGDISLEADSVLLKKKEQTIIAYGARNIKFKGDLVPDKRIITYKWGSKSFYEK